MQTIVHAYSESVGYDDPAQPAVKWQLKMQYAWWYESEQCKRCALAPELLDDTGSRVGHARGQVVQQRILEGAAHHDKVLPRIRHLLRRQPVLRQAQRWFRGLPSGKTSKQNRVRTTTLGKAPLPGINVCMQ